MLTPEQIEWLKSPMCDNTFKNSLKTQFMRTSYFSTKQKFWINKFIDEKSSPIENLNAGSQIEITRWLANTLKDNLSMPLFFRNLKIDKVHKKTAKAYICDVSFVSQVATSCHCCGKALTDPVSQATGIGPVCAKRYLGINKPTLEAAQQIRDAMEQRAKEYGIIQNVVIAKKCIKSIN